jgi:hypothetical protein
MVQRRQLKNIPHPLMAPPISCCIKDLAMFQVTSWELKGVQPKPIQRLLSVLTFSGPISLFFTQNMEIYSAHI